MSAAALEMHIAEAMAARLAALVGERGAAVFASALYGLDPGALESWPKTPAALVLPISIEAEESTTRKVPQPPVQHFIRIGVAYLVRAPNDRKGALASERLSPVAGAARGALAGWKPPGQREVLSFRAGRLVDISSGRVQWTDEFEIRRVASAGALETA